MEYQELLHRCFRCGWCKLPLNYVDINCPVYLMYRFESYSPGAGSGSYGLAERRDRDERAPQGDHIRLRHLQELRRGLRPAENKGQPRGHRHCARNEIVQTGKLPAKVRDYFMKIYDQGNPYGRPQSERHQWMKGLEVPIYDGHEFLLFIGDAGSFDESGMEMARSVAQLLCRGGVSFGILGEDEISDGNDVYALGEKDLFKHTAGRQMEIFRKRKVRKIVTLSPHAYNAFKNYYPIVGAQYDVMHYTHLIAFRAGKFPAGRMNARSHSMTRAIWAGGTMTTTPAAAF